MYIDVYIHKKEGFPFMKSKLNALGRLDKINELPNKMLN